MPAYNEYSELLKQRENRLLEREIQIIMNENGQLLRPFTGLLDDIDNRNNDTGLLTMKCQLVSAIPQIKMVESNLTTLAEYEKTEPMSGGIRQMRMQCYTAMTIANVREFVQKTDMCISNCKEAKTVVNSLNKIGAMQEKNKKVFDYFHGINSETERFVHGIYQSLTDTDISVDSINARSLTGKINNFIGIFNVKLSFLRTIMSELTTCKKRWYYTKKLNSQIDEVSNRVQNEMTLNQVKKCNLEVSDLNKGANNVDFCFTFFIVFILILAAHIIQEYII